MAEAIERGEDVDVPDDYDVEAGVARLRAFTETNRKLVNLMQLVRTGMPQWREHHGMGLKTALEQFWPR